MRKVVAILSFLFTVAFTPFVDAQSTQAMGLDEVIQNAAKRVEEAMAQGVMIAVLNFTSPSETFSDYVVEELTGELVRGRKVTIVDRRRLALIREEMNLQLSGDISDDSAQAIGRQLGAQSIVSGNLTNLGTHYRFRVIVISVESATIEYQTSLNLRDDQQVTFLLESDSQGITSTVTTRPSTATPAPTQVPSAAITPQGNNIVQQLEWIANQGGNGTVYDIVISNDVSMRTAAVSTRGRDITVNIRSADSANPRIIELTGQGPLFSVESNITLILQDIILKGHGNNNSALVYAETGGKVILNSGSKITGNTNISNTASGGGIRLDRGILEINDGAEISGNTVRGGNSANPHRDVFGAWDAQGGGIYAGNRSTVTIRGGLITDNKVDTRGGAYGGGIFIIDGSTVTMSGGIISRNSCTVGYNGYRNGGGVFIFDAVSTFTKKPDSGSNASGIIYGSAGGNANAATDGGHAIFRYYANPKQRNSTLGYDDEISTASNAGWER
jgi:TolB-like protein